MLKIKYILSNFFKIFLISSISFVLLFILVRIIDDFSDLLTMGRSVILWRYLYDIPEVFVEISPVITFLSAMFLLSEMLKYGEIKLLEISGINHIKIFYLISLCGLLISISVFYIKNFTVPYFSEKKNKILEIKSIHFSSPEYLLFSEKFIHPATFEEIQLSQTTEDKNLQVIKAKRGIYQGENLWEFENGNLWLFDTNGHLIDTKFFNTSTYSLSLVPEVLIASSKNLETLSYFELKNLSLDSKKLGIFSRKLESYFYERIAYPLLNFFLLFILLPFFSVNKKISRVFVLSMSIILSFISYGIYAFGFGLSTAGKVHPILGVWVLHILIILFSIVYILKLQKRGKSNII